MKAIDAEELKRSIAVSALIEDQKTLEQIIDEQPTIDIKLDWAELTVICNNCGHAIHVKRTDVKPIIDPERKKGKWLEDDEQIHVELTYHCSECGFQAWGEYEKTDYCGGCGADMRETP